MSLESLLKLIDTHSVRLVRLLYCDTSNLIRGKAINADFFSSRATSGVGLVKGMMAMNMLDEMQIDTGYGAIGEVRLLPDLNTFRILPYCPASALLICDLLELNKQPWVLCPRSILKKQIQKYAEIKFEAAFEPEFFLGKLEDNKFIPIDESNCFSTEGMNQAASFTNDLISALASQNLVSEQYYPELGHGQHELSIQHAQALQAADNHLIYRETLRGIATKHALVASLAPKPILDGTGSGCHLHLSAWNTKANTNLFYSETGLSTFGTQFVAGLLKHLKAIVSITCPSVNSYRRINPESWSSAYTCWGYENREAAIRIPSLYWDQEMQSTNIEVKCVDSSANPYLALAVIIAAGMEGVKEKLAPPIPLPVDPSSLSSDDAIKYQVHRLPCSLEEALKELSSNQLLLDTLGEEFARTYLSVKQSEVKYFAKVTPKEEIRAHLIKY